MSVIPMPPPLPPFLSDRFKLKVIEGAPSDEDVKIVHAVIRALGEAANIPILYDADLAVRLSQYLFTIQMARYREKHPVVVFPTRITHDPPSLPSHILADLHTVTGSPSDEEVKQVQEAIRQSENLVHVPSMFDADLSMKLSQHLFNIQFERYIHEVSTGLGQEGSKSENNNTPSAPQIGSTNRTSKVPSSRNSLDVPPGVSGLVKDELGEGAAANTESRAGLRPAGHVNSEMEETNRLLVRLGDKMDDLKRFLVGAQHSMAMGWNATNYNRKSEVWNHGLVSEKGEIIVRWSHRYEQQFRTELVTETVENVDNDKLLAYLKLHSLEKEFISGGTNPTLIPDKKAEAIAALRLHLGI